MDQSSHQLPGAVRDYRGYTKTVSSSMLCLIFVEHNGFVRGLITLCDRALHTVAMSPAIHTCQFRRSSDSSELPPLPWGFAVLLGVFPWTSVAKLEIIDFSQTRRTFLRQASPHAANPVPFIPTATTITHVVGLARVIGPR